MKISTKVVCGIMAITDIALYSQEGKAVTVLSISGRREISEKYLEQILPSLRHAKLIKSLKGSRGGYVLAKDAKEITLAQIINALDSNILNNEIPTVNEESDSFDEIIKTLLWDKIEVSIQSIAESVTLAQLTSAYLEKIEEAAGAHMYYI
ncbi:MAG: Rrf2 family transcriptional regulator [Ruminococcus sp.]|nr:Rrf2 family transcriptional regulator [Ruminococcus sp.]